MTLELSPELEMQIEHEAQLRGMDAPSFIIEATRRALETQEAPVEAKSKETRSFGFLRGQVSGSDAFLEERHARLSERG